MSNQTEIDYEKQFQEDLAKATALSLEQQALEEFKRCQKYGSAYAQSVQQEAKNRNYAQIRRQHYARRDSTESSGYCLSLPPPQSNQQQRRHSEITHNAPPTSTLLTDIERSRTPPVSTTVVAENDLINFASPTSKKPENTSFEQLIEDLQKLQATNPQTALVPLGPTAAAPLYPGYHAPATQAAGIYAGSAAAIQPPAQYGVTTAAGAAGLQLVPFTPPPQREKVPLTHNELQKLYSMSQSPYTAPIYGPRPMGFVPPIQGTTYYPPSPPVMVGAAGVPYTAPAQYTNPFGYQYNMQQQHYYASSMASASSSHSSIAASNNLAPGLHNLNHPAEIAVNTPSNLSSSSSSFNPMHSKPPSSSGISTQNNGQNNFRRQTPPARKPKATGSDLIDLSHEDDSRVSVLEAFDPLLNEHDDVTKRLNK